MKAPAVNNSYSVQKPILNAVEKRNYCLIICCIVKTKVPPVQSKGAIEKFLNLNMHYWIKISLVLTTTLDRFFIFGFENRAKAGIRTV